MFKYRYQRHPFDEWQFLSVEAPSQEQADAMAKRLYRQMFDGGKTVTIDFYRVPPVRKQDLDNVWVSRFALLFLLVCGSILALLRVLWRNETPP